MARGRSTTSWYPAKTLLSLLLMAVLLSTAACLAAKPKPPPPLKTPSKVITEEGIEFFVYGLKLPGTSQELKLRKGGSTTWLPLSLIEIITFTGQEEERFRPADIVLYSGEKLQGDLFVGQIIEGGTDLGYWNMSLSRVHQLGMGEE
jgi:hypothetical protein